MNAAPADPGSGWRWLEICGQPHELRHAGWDQPLELRTRAGGASWCLPPWRYRDHLAGLRAGLHLAPIAPAGEEPLALDTQRYLGGMAAYAGLDPATRAERLPLALWWAGGGDAAPAVRRDASGVTEIDGLSFRLQGWSERARLAALLACLIEEPGEGAGGRFDAVAYLDAMVRQTVLAEGDVLDELPTHWALPLIDEVVGLNVVKPEAEPLPMAGPRAQAAAAQTLRLCRALGWTPSQVWAAPAAEIDRLNALLDRVEQRHATTAPPVAARRSRLAEHPDAVLIRIED